MARKREPRIVGLDLSLTATGIAHADGSTSTVKNSKITGTKRLLHLYLSVYNACLLADFVVIEDLPTHAKSAGLTGKAHGVVELALEQLGAPFIKIPPSTLKKAATGDGTADKDAMRAAYFEAQGDDGWDLSAPPVPADADQMDAWWFRQAGLALLGHESHLADPPALDKYKEDPVVVMTKEVLDG
jgi:hypothetical protein